MGETAIAAGVGISMLGGLLQSMGLEEVGEGVSEFGNIITLAGTAIITIIPIIKTLSSALVTGGVSAQAAWWWAILIVAAVAALVVGIVAIATAVKNASIEERMKKAAQATEEAKKAADSAKEAYDELLSNKEAYNETQKALEDLVYGTKEWKTALYEANQQVLELLEKYPELVKYLSRGQDGQLTIDEAGFDSIIAQQEKAVANAQALVGANQLDEQKLKMEKAKEDFNDKTVVIRNQNTENERIDFDATEGLREDLEDLYLVQDSSLTEQTGKAEELAKKYQVTTDQIWSTALALEKSKNEIEGIALETENIARANLTAQASQKVQESDFGKEVIDTFASSQTGDLYQQQINDKKASMDVEKDYAENADIKALAEEYGVSNELNGDDTHDLQVLYAKMSGLESIEDIPDGIAASEEKMLEAIAKMDVANDQSEKMDDYIDKLEGLNEEDQNNIAGIFSQSGKGMSIDFAESVKAGFEDDADGNAALEEQAKKLGYNSIEEWASALNMTVEDFYDKAEENARAAVTARTQAYSKLNKALGKSDEERIEKLSETVELSAGQEEALAEKLVGVINTAGVEAGASLQTTLGSALNSLGEDADSVASYLGSMNWNDLEAWEELPEVFKEMGISITPELEKLITDAKNAGIAVSMVDFNKLNEEIKSTYDTLKSIKSGEQGREFDQKTYEQLIVADKTLADKFVQVGDKFVYMGSSMDTLTGALEQNTVALLNKATKQLEGKKNLATLAENKVSSMGSDLSITDDFSKWTATQKQDFLESYRNSAAEKYGSTDPNILSNITDSSGKSLGMSFATDFSLLTEEEMDKFLAGIKKNYDERADIEEEYQKKMSEARIVGYTLNSATANATKAKELRETKEGDEYSKALSLQAVQSGGVANSVIDDYNALIEKETLTDQEKIDMEELEKTIQEGIDRMAKSLEHLNNIADLQSKVEEALYNASQRQIDELSNINSSVEAANAALINEMRTQVAEERQREEQEKAMADLADKETRLAYLMRDTSGANAMEVASLQKEVTSDKEQMGDNLIDQKLDALEDANAKAAEQRQKQIDLAQAQLDWSRESGQLSQEAARITNESLAQVNSGVDPLDTELANILSAENNWGAMTSEQLAAEQQQFTTMVNTAADSKEVLEAVEQDTSSTSTYTDEVAEKTATDVSSQAILDRLGAINAQEKNRDTAAKAAAEAIVNGADSGGFAKKEDNSAYVKAKQDYIANGGRAEDFDAVVAHYISSGKGLSTTEKVGTDGQIYSGTFPGSSVSGMDGNAAGDYDNVDVTIPGYGTFNVEVGEGDQKYSGVSDDLNKKITNLSGGTPSNGWLALYEGVPYVYKDGYWRIISQSSTQPNANALAEAMKKSLNTYETGGLADFTGPAWLDGTKSRPEYVLNAAQTERFFSLIDVLEKYDSSDAKKQSGDNYFEIEINVEKLENDYDVEQLAYKIRSMIYDDAIYRNVNSISTVR